jgi:hypothetical protein
MIERADALLYQAKNAGRNAVRFEADAALAKHAAGPIPPH